MSHSVRVSNDFGTVVWTEKWENALVLMAVGASRLQITPAEFVEMMLSSDRKCPKCRAGEH